MTDHSPAITAIITEISRVETKKNNAKNLYDQALASALKDYEDETRHCDEVLKSLHSSLAQLGGSLDDQIAALPSSVARLIDNKEYKICLYSGKHGLRIMSSGQSLEGSLEYAEKDVGTLDMARSAVFFVSSETIAVHAVAELKNIVESRFAIISRKLYNSEAFDILLPFMFSWAPMLSISEYRLFETKPPEYPTLPEAPLFETFEESAKWAYEQYQSSETQMAQRWKTELFDALQPPS